MLIYSSTFWSKKKFLEFKLFFFFLYMLSLVLFWSKGKCYICIRTSVKFFIKPPEDVKTDHLKIARIHITGEVVSHIEKISVDLLRFSENNQKKTHWLHYLKTDLFFLPVTKTFCIWLEKTKKSRQKVFTWVSVCHVCVPERPKRRTRKEKEDKTGSVASTEGRTWRPHILLRNGGCIYPFVTRPQIQIQPSPLLSFLGNALENRWMRERESMMQRLGDADWIPLL